ncbi:MAG: tryptophan-rich sensory protein [Chthoniobacterales bacterium]|nr:tryptophan-rich sensory protein [Chthoniobacterales bacterium]
MNAVDAALNSTRPRGREILALAGWVAFSLTAAASGIFVSTGGWYEELPEWNPPAWLFGPVWTTLYIMMGVAAWLVWKRGGWRERGGALALFVAQWLLNALRTPLFFGLRRPGLAFAEILLLWVAIAATMIAFWRVTKPAAFLLVPYLAWVTFAAVLNFTIWNLNR